MQKKKCYIGRNGGTKCGAESDMTSFVIADILGGGKLQLIGNIIEQEFVKSMNWHLGAGLSISLMLLVIVGLAFTLRNDMEERGTTIW